jgi:hypothetical protein
MILHWIAGEIPAADGDYLTLRAATALRWNDAAGRDEQGHQQNRMSHVTIEDLLSTFAKQ